MSGKCPDGLLVPGGNLPRVCCPRDVFAVRDSFLQGSCPQGSCPRGSCLWGSCPRTRCTNALSKIRKLNHKMHW